MSTLSKNTSYCLALCILAIATIILASFVFTLGLTESTIMFKMFLLGLSILLGVGSLWFGIQSLKEIHTHSFVERWVAILFSITSFFVAIVSLTALFN